MFLKIKREIRSHPTVHIALAIYLAWLPVVVVTAFIIVCMDSRVDVSERLLHHLYDAGQILVIAGMVWALLMLLGRGRWFTGHRILVLASLVAWGLSFALMYSDLENFVERHGERVPWRHLFATVAAGGLVGTGIVARWIGRTALWWIGGLIGIVVMIVNHQILELAYPGVHTLLILGAVILGSVSKVRTEYFGRGDVLCGFGEPRKYRVFSSVRRSRRVHCPARKTTGGLLRQSLISLRAHSEG
jgi:hypothetical protein